MRPVRQVIAGLGLFAALVAADTAAARPDTLNLTMASNDFTTTNAGAGAVTTGRTLEWDSRKGRWSSAPIGWANGETFSRAFTTGSHPGSILAAR